MVTFVVMTSNIARRRTTPSGAMTSTLVAVGLCAMFVAAAAANGSSPPPKLELLEGNRDLAKLSSRLLEARRLAGLASSQAQIRESIPRLPIRNGKVAVEIRFQAPGKLPLKSLEAAGVEELRVYPDLAGITARVALGSLDEIAAISDVVSVRELLPPRRRAGLVTSQGDASVRADLARALSNVDGTGVTVGILSDSFNQDLGTGSTIVSSSCQPDEMNPAQAVTLTGSDPQIQGELPASIEILEGCTNVDNCAAPLDEGRALAEIVHDVAPGAEIMFRSGFNGELDMATGINELVTCGADVIIDHLIYDAEPMFQDGPVAQAAQNAVEAGVAYFSSAGNEAGFGIADEFLDIDAASDDEAFPPTGSDFHDFGGGDQFASIRIADGCGATFVLQWNEPFEAPLGEGASSDLDLYLCDNETFSFGDCPYVSESQGCSITPDPEGGPFEVVTFSNDSGSAETVHLVIDHFCSRELPYPQQEDTYFRLVVFADNCSLGDAETSADCSSSSASYCFEEGIFEDFQIYGHGAAEGVVAVGASFYDEIDSDGALDPPSGQIDVEPFSSLGGTLPIYFDGTGNPLPGAPVTRFKPDVTGPDGVNTSFFGSPDPDPGGAFEGDGYPNFFGSSSAAAHAAAIAALVREANPLLDAIDVKDVLVASARDIEAVGPDALSGSGLIDGVDALGLSLPVPEATPSTLNYGSLNIAQSLEAIVTISNTTTGPADLAVSSMVLSDLADFSLDPTAGGDGCGSTTPLIVPGDNCTVGVTFDPATAGVFSESLTIASNGPTEMVTLLGTACTAQVDRVLTSGSGVSGPLTVEACDSITAGPYPIVSGSVSFRAGRRIVLWDGFSIGAGASFSAAIDANLLLQ
jgi:hypothetical protein